jgi:hypothetical protein
LKARVAITALMGVGVCWTMLKFFVFALKFVGI